MTALGEAELGLQNVYAIYVREELPRNDLTELVIEHFQHSSEIVDQVLKYQTPPWERAHPRLRPQFMPAEYLERIPVLHIPFHTGLHIGIVLDDEDHYAYVREEDAPVWGLQPQELLEIAVTNLAVASKGMEITTSQGPERFLGLEVKDGCDAARILMPGLRDFAADELRQPFFVAIPNRDFLLLWFASCSPEFHRFARDFGIQPYPLTPEIFQADRQGLRPADAT